mgnify:CR=1 FL=1
MKKLAFAFSMILSFSILCYSQSNKSEFYEKGINRYHHANYKSFRQYLQHNLIFPEEAANMEVTGVLMAGLKLDSKGEIVQVFTLNSLYPSIDKHVRNLFDSSQGHWEAISDTIDSRNLSVVIVPIIYTFGKLDYKIHRENFKLPVAQRVVLKVYSNGNLGPSRYKEKKTLMRKYHRLFKREKYYKARMIIKELITREPLNMKYYEELVKIEFKLGNNEIACQNYNFIKSNFKKEPDPTLVKDYSCN